MILLHFSTLPSFGLFSNDLLSPNHKPSLFFSQQSSEILSLSLFSFIVCDFSLKKMVEIEQCSDAGEDKTTRDHTKIEALDAQTEELAREEEGFETASEGGGDSDGEEQKADASKSGSCEDDKPTEEQEQLQQVSLIKCTFFLGIYMDGFDISNCKKPFFVELRCFWK